MVVQACSQYSLASSSILVLCSAADIFHGVQVWFSLLSMSPRVGKTLACHGITATDGSLTHSGVPQHPYDIRSIVFRHEGKSLTELTHWNILRALVARFGETRHACSSWFQHWCYRKQVGAEPSDTAKPARFPCCQHRWAELLWSGSGQQQTCKITAAKQAKNETHLSRHILCSQLMAQLQ
jgi:hypothetical protein